MQLLYLSTWEDDFERTKREEDFKNLIFANDLWPDDRSLINFREIFKEELEPESPEDVEWVVPTSPDEIAEVMAAVAGKAPVEEPIEEQRV